MWHMQPAPPCDKDVLHNRCLPQYNSKVLKPIYENSGLKFL